MFPLLRPTLWILVLVLSGRAVSAQACMTTNGRIGRTTDSQHWSQSDSDRGLKSTTIRWKRGDCELRVDARGDFTVRADLTGLTSVDDYVELEERDGDHSRKVRVTGGAGALQYR